MDDSFFLFVLIATAGVCGAIGYALGHGRGRGADGFALGVLLGPIGCIIAAFLSEKGKKCPECLGDVPNAAIRCKHCGIALVTKPITSAPLRGEWDASFYVLRGEETEGPFSLKQIRIFIAAGSLTRETLCAREGAKEWEPVGNWL